MENLKKQIETLLYEDPDSFAIAKALKEHIKRYFETLPESFADTGGKDFLIRHTRHIDALLKLIFHVAMRRAFGEYLPLKNSLPVTLVAMGSYGREQLCVYSDIDLMILYKEVPGYNTQMIIEKVLYLIWDSGLKLGHRVHQIDELAKISRGDITIKTALIESRFIDGSHALWTEAQNVLARIRKDRIDDFVRYRLEERNAQYRKDPITMEPNLKEGTGGFRDANLIYWIGSCYYGIGAIKDLPPHIVKEEEYKPFRIALEFLFRVRSALHLVAGKKEDKLRLELLPDVSKLLGYDEGYNAQLKFAQKTIEALKTIRLYSLIWSERLTGIYLPVCDNALVVKAPETPTSFTKLLQHLCRHAENVFEAHPTLLDALAHTERPDRPHKTLLKIIASFFEQPHAYSILEALSLSKTLRYVIPPMRKVVSLPQFDGYHHFAVDIHSLRSLYHLERIEEDYLRSLYETLSKRDKRLVKLTTFLHDAGKGRKRDHHQVGASLFKVFAAKLGMNEEEIKRGERLIQYHTLMSNVAQREDIYNEKIVFGFASHFPDTTLLKMIYLLTYADLKGVGGDIYNSFTAKLLRTLYKHAVDALEHRTILDEAAKRAKKEAALRRHPQFRALRQSQQRKILSIPSNLLFLRYGTQRIMDIVLKAFETDNYSYHISNDINLTIEIIRAHSINLSYLLGKLHALEVVNMDISKLFDGKKYFKIDFAHRVDESEIPLIERIVHESFDCDRSYPLRKPTLKAEDIDIDCDHSKSYAVMHLRAPDQKGLLAYVIKLFDSLGIDIVTAKVHTIKKRTRDLFLIEKNGNFCHNTELIIRKLTDDTTKKDG